MDKYIVRDSYEHKWLQTLGYRKDPDTIAICVNRLRMGEKPYSLYGFHASDPIVSQDLGRKIARDYRDGKLDFIQQFDADEGERARHDPFRFTRYDIVQEAEEMAPYSLWNLGHLKKLGMSLTEAIELMKTYDRIKDIRIEAEVSVTSFGRLDEKVMFETPPTMAMRDFRDLPQYLRIHYLVYYRTAYPDAHEDWAVRASEARATGKLNDEHRLVVSADNLYRYEIWDQENHDSYFDSLVRLSKTKLSHEKFMGDITKRYGIYREIICGGTDNE